MVPYEEEVVRMKWQVGEGEGCRRGGALLERLLHLKQVCQELSRDESLSF